jgi:hypothetical protein
VYGGAGDEVTVNVRVRRGGGHRCILISGGHPVSMTTLTSDDQTIEAKLPIPPFGGYVRAEVRSAEHPVEGQPGVRELDMECLTNPIWLLVGNPPAGYRPEHAPPPPLPGPRRTLAA